MVIITIENLRWRAMQPFVHDQVIATSKEIMKKTRIVTGKMSRIYNPEVLQYIHTFPIKLSTPSNDWWRIEKRVVYRVRLCSQLEAITKRYESAIQ